MLQIQNFIPIDASTDLEAVMSLKFGDLVGPLGFIYVSNLWEYLGFRLRY
jgi:hypothetical protein